MNSSAAYSEEYLGMTIFEEGCARFNQVHIKQFTLNYQIYNCQGITIRNPSGLRQVSKQEVGLVALSCSTTRKVSMLQRSAYQFVLLALTSPDIPTFDLLGIKCKNIKRLGAIDRSYQSAGDIKTILIYHLNVQLAVLSFTPTEEWKVNFG